MKQLIQNISTLAFFFAFLMNAYFASDSKADAICTFLRSLKKRVIQLSLDFPYQRFNKLNSLLQTNLHNERYNNFKSNGG